MYCVESSRWFCGFYSAIIEYKFFLVSQASATQRNQENKFAMECNDARLILRRKLKGATTR